MPWQFMSSWPACAQSLDVFMAGDDVDKKKPDPMIYRIAAERLNVDPKHCLVVEDSTIGLQVLRRPLSLYLELHLENCRAWLALFMLALYFTQSSLSAALLEHVKSHVL